MQILIAFKYYVLSCILQIHLVNDHSLFFPDQQFSWIIGPSPGYNFAKGILNEMHGLLEGYL